MLKLKTVVCIILVVLLALPLVVFGNTGSTADPEPGNLLRQTKSSIEERYELDSNKSLAVFLVKEKSEGPIKVGTGVLNEAGVDCQQLKGDILYFYNESRIKEMGRLSGARYWLFSNLSILEQQGSIVVNNDFRKQQRGSGRSLEVKDTIYLDWRYKDTVKVGDTILVDLGTQHWVNPNEGIDETIQHLIVDPVIQTGAKPYIAVFVDGKLQLDQEMEAVFSLERLYEDTEPDLTEIHDGDSIESVIAFLSSVEQDVARYRKENPECYVEVVKPEMSVSGTDLICKAGVNAKGKKIEAKLELFGFDDKLVATWTASGSDSVAFEETVPVEFSVVYRLKISGTVDGEQFPYDIRSSLIGYPD